MNTKSILPFIILLLVAISCNQKSEKKIITEVNQNLDPKVDFKELETNFLKWWTYHENNITLSSNFIGLNERSEKIDKKIFLEKLSSGKYITLQLQTTEDSKNHYQLIKLSSNSDENIKNTIKSQALIELKHHQMEGDNFFEFDFTDLNGKQYTSENTKGKILILKTWFIKCKACIEEFPELNDFVDKNIENENVVFISLATDSEEELKLFLYDREFKYKVVSNQESVIEEKLGLQIYPTHIIRGENGKILKVVNKASEMISFFEESNILIKNKEIPPPPPPM